MQANAPAWLQRPGAEGARDALVARNTLRAVWFAQRPWRRGVAGTLCDEGVAATLNGCLMRKKENDKIAPAELARENARLRGDLLTVGGRISHDLRTPLGGLINVAELLREILTEKDPAAVSLTDSLFNSVDEMTRLIQQFSFVAKASASPARKKTVRMGEIVSGVLQRLESMVLKRDATVVEPAAWPEIEGVAGWLEWIWWNFLLNALQHGGPKIQLGWRHEKQADRFWICDDGQGVPEPARAKLFQPFDSLHQPDSTRGLGLSVVQRLVDLQGGQCGYESNVGEACFFFTLPHAKISR
jgi:signal transduction histidine kinase